MNMPDLRKTAKPSDPSQPAKNSFSSVDVSMDTSPAEKKLFNSSESGPGRRAILRKASKQQQLDDLQAQIEADKICPELAAQATQQVFGVGNPDAGVVFIGEAPGKKEDLKGEPFIGAAGKFLNEMLATIGMERKQIYITNIVKYRPPNNRDPLPEEKAAFLPYLEKQIEIIDPKLIITLGRHSMDVLLPGLIISQAHGQVQKYKNRLFLPLFHPAAALYNGGLRQTLLDDFAKIPNLLETN